MVVCHFISGGLFAGAEVMATNLLNYGKERNDLEVYAILLNTGTLESKLNEIGVTVYVIDESINSFFSIVKKFRKFLFSIKCDIIHTHGYKESLIAAIAKIFNKRLKLVRTQHGMPEIYSGIKKFKYALLMFLNNLVLRYHFNMVVFVSEKLRQNFLIRKNFKKDKTKVIHNGINIQKRRVLKKRETFLIGSAGRFSEVKNYLLYVEIAHLLNRRIDNIECLLIGEGPLKAKIVKKVHDYGLAEKFHLIDFNPDLNEFYMELDLYINTSFSEGIPMTILEAMSYSIPVVASNVGGIGEIIDHNIDGILINGHDPDKFAQRIIDIFIDEKLRRKLQRNSFEKIEKKFTVSSMFEKYLNLYNDVFLSNI